MRDAPYISHFVLQGLDSVTQTVCVERCVTIAHFDRLRTVLAPESDGDPDLNWVYGQLSAPQMRQIGELCEPPIEPEAIFTGIMRFSEYFDSVPYLIHTGFELPMMLEGRKPLAVFGDGYPSEWFDDYLSPFKPFVASGRLVRHIIDTPMPHLKLHRPDLDGMRNVLFALPEEKWRIDAYIARIMERERDWDDDLEREQGSLLGYEDWQNDWWIEQRVKRRQDGGN